MAAILTEHRIFFFNYKKINEYINVRKKGKLHYTHQAFTLNIIPRHTKADNPLFG